MMYIFVFEQTGLKMGRLPGRLRSTARPKFMDKLETAGLICSVHFRYR
jgi:hypothetical protein